MTVGDLKRHLQVYSDDWEIEFSRLSFYRVKERGPNLAQVEFCEPFERLHNPQTGQDDLILRIKARSTS